MDTLGTSELVGAPNEKQSATGCETDVSHQAVERTEEGASTSNPAGGVAAESADVSLEGGAGVSLEGGAGVEAVGVYRRLRYWALAHRAKFISEEGVCTLCDAPLETSASSARFVMHVLAHHGDLLRTAFFPSPTAPTGASTGAHSANSTHSKQVTVRMQVPEVAAPEDSAQEMDGWPPVRRNKHRESQIVWMKRPPRDPRTRALFEEADAFLECTESKSNTTWQHYRCGVCSQQAPDSCFTVRLHTMRFHVLTNHLDHRLLDLVYHWKPAAPPPIKNVSSSDY